MFSMKTIEEFFAGQPESAWLFEAVRRVIDSVGPSEIRVTKSQIAFHRRRGFAWAWMPGQYLRREVAPLVLTLGLRRHDASPRWKQIVEPTPERFTHHLELYELSDIDDEVREWVREAWEEAA